MRRRGLEQQSLYGALKGYGRKEIVAVLDGLIERGAAGLVRRRQVGAAIGRRSPSKVVVPAEDPGAVHKFGSPRPESVTASPPSPPVSRDEPVPRRACLAILRLLQRWPDGLHRSGVANVLRGARASDIVTRMGTDAFPELGALKDEQYHDLVRWVDQMIAKGYCARSGRGAVTLSERGRNVLDAHWRDDAGITWEDERGGGSPD